MLYDVHVLVFHEEPGKEKTCSFAFALLSLITIGVQTRLITKHTVLVLYCIRQSFPSVLLLSSSFLGAFVVDAVRDANL